MNKATNINITVIKDKGFTIIETLVAVAILMISIAGPLSIAQKGLTAAVYARDQVVASFLAQDVMEYIKNKRDTAINDNPDAGFDSWLTELTNAGCEARWTCNVDTYTNSSILIDKERMYISDTGFSPYSTGEESQFSRTFYFEQIRPGEVKVTVMVEWTNGTIANIVTLENEMFNIERI